MESNCCHLVYLFGGCCCLSVPGGICSTWNHIFMPRNNLATVRDGNYKGDLLFTISYSVSIVTYRQ